MEDKIIDYVTQTPENTNPAVLNTLLKDLKGSSIDSADVVKIVKDEFVAAPRKKNRWWIGSKWVEKVKFDFLFFFIDWISIFQKFHFYLNIEMHFFLIIIK